MPSTSHEAEGTGALNDLPRSASPYEAYALGLLTMLISKHMESEVVRAMPGEGWVEVKAKPSGKVLRLTLEEVTPK